jgi:WD40 repeat protein
MAADSSERLVLLNRLADEFAARYRRGERPSLQEYIDRHPELAGDIREFFPAVVDMEQVKEDRQEVREPPAAGPLPPLERLGDFCILREVGRGGMGVVYEAEQVSLGRHVALKVLPPKVLADLRTRQRFEREAKAAARLHHTNIVPVFGVGEHEGLPYYVMQFIPGRGLDEVMQELKQLQPGATGSGSGPHPTGSEPRGSPGGASAADVARSLWTGRFVPAGEKEALEPAPLVDATVDQVPGAPGSSPGANAAGSPKETPVAGRLSETFSPSSSSAVLPGSASVRRRQPSYWQSVARLGVQVACALEHAHQQGVLHRDIKPSNLLLDAHGTVWVTDFGLAKAEGSENLTHTGDILGTLRYMPPEAFDGKTDPRSDIYSLGLTLYELLALQPAFAERDRPGLIKRVTTAEPTRLDVVNPAIPRDLVTIVQKAIDREPGRRYATAGELAGDLQRFLDDQPIRARRVSALEQLARWGRHHPGVAASLAVIALLLVAVAVASAVTAWRFERLAGERELARAAADAARREAEEAADEARRRGEAERWERYRSNIAAAAAALQLQNRATAQSALEAAPPEHRNWEWQHFRSQLDGSRAVLDFPADTTWIMPFHGIHFEAWSRPKRGPVRLVDPTNGRTVGLLPVPMGERRRLHPSPNARHLAVAQPDGSVQLWDVAAGRETAVLRVTNSTLLPWAFSGDGRRLVTTGSEHPSPVRLWDVVTGREVAVLTMAGNICPLTALGVTPDGGRIAYPAGDCVKVWDGASGQEVARIGLDGEIHALAISPDATRIVLGANYPDTRVRLWDVRAGKPIAVMQRHANTITSLAFSPDGTRIASASWDQTVQLWDGKTLQPIATLRGHTAPVGEVLFSPDSQHLISTCQDGAVRLVDAQTGELRAVLLGHADLPHAVFSRDGALLMTVASDGSLRLWDVKQHQRSILRGHTGFVYDVAFGPDGEQVASAAWDGTARLWDATTGRQTGLLKHETKIVTSAAYGCDGRRLATVERGRGPTLWDVGSRKAARAWRAPAGYWGADTRAALNPAGTLLAAGCAEGPVRLWDVAGGQELGQLRGHEGCSIDVAFAPGGNRLATAGEDGTVRLWDVATRAPLAVLRGHTNKVWRVAFSADGNLLASGSDDKTIRFWDARTGESRAVIPAGSVVYGLAFSPDGTRLAAGCGDNTVRLFDVAARQQIAELRGHTDYVHAVAWSPDGTRLASGSEDFTVRVWDALPPAVRARPPDAYLPPRG